MLLSQIVRRPIGMSFIAIAFAVLGAMAFQKLPSRLMPGVKPPVLSVWIEKEDASPEEIEQDLLRRLEERLSTISGLRQMESRAKLGKGELTLTFSSDSDVQETAQDIREMLGSISLGSNIKPPRVLRFDPNSEPVIRLAFLPQNHGSDLNALSGVLKDKLLPRLEGLPEVASVRLRGIRDMVLKVVPEESKMLAMGVKPVEISRILKSGTGQASLGRLLNGGARRNVKVLGSAQEPMDLMNLEVEAGLRLKDMARLELSYEDAEELIAWRSDDMDMTEPALMMEVMPYLESGVVNASDAILSQLGRLGKEVNDDQGQSWLMYGAKAILVNDQSVPIRSALNEVRDAVVQGALLAWIILWLFMRNIKSSSMVFVAVPLSVVVTFLLMDQANVGLNMMSLSGLALGVGMLVDNAIVVLESVEHYREVSKSHAKEDRYQVVVKGVREVATAVMASTATTVAVFLPLTFLEGYIGGMLFDQAYTVSMSLLVSLLVAIGLLPALIALPEFKRSGQKLPWSWPKVHGSEKGDGKVLYKFIHPLWYAVTLLRWILVNSLRVLFLMIELPFKLVFLILRTPSQVLLWCFDKMLIALQRFHELILRPLLHQWIWGWMLFVLMLYLSFVAYEKLPHRFMPPVTASMFNLMVKLEHERTVEETQAWSMKFCSMLQDKYSDLRVFATSGEHEQYASMSGKRESYQLKVSVIPKQKFLNTAEDRKFMREIEAMAMAEGAVEASASTPPAMDLGLQDQGDFSVHIFGPDRDALRRLEQDIRIELKNVGAIGIQSSLVPPIQELVIRPDSSKLLQYGIKLEQLKTAISQACREETLSGFFPTYTSNSYERSNEQSGTMLPIKLWGARMESNIDNMGQMNVGSGSRIVNLDSVAEIEMTETPSALYKRDGKIALSVTAAILPFGVSSGDIKRKIVEMLPSRETFGLMEGVSFLEGSSKALVEMLALSIFLVVVIMAVQFESISQPLLIILSVPMASTGSLWGLHLTGHGLDLMSGIGMVILVGVAVNNAIVLVNTSNLRMSEGLAPLDAILMASKDRFRPILMTALTTIVGLLPLALGWGDSAALRAPLAISVIGGLLSSTLLVLLVLPSMVLSFKRTSKK